MGGRSILGDARSPRVQSVHVDTNPRYHALITSFEQKTGCPVIINTSLNVRGEPIVGTPEDAFRCFMGAELDCLAVRNCWLEKADQPESLRVNYEGSFVPD
ncbi:MAG: carbamoyltransferase C-terminal domain-containing protein [Burkholderiaceae bacterium]